MSIIKRFFKEKKGQSMVELALTLPILLVLLGGILDFGWIYGKELATTYICREGARYGVINADSPDLNTLVDNKVRAAAPSYARDSLVVTTTLTSPSDPRSGDVIVKVDYKFTVLTPLASIIIHSNQYTVSAECTMKAE
jgi:Flp pilus assembly protein TadG